jgi:hypothetical protein
VSMILVAGATLECSHGGRITVAAGSAQLTVDGHGAVVVGSEAGLSFAAGSPPCPNATTSTPPAPAPCTTVAATSGQATKLTVGSRPALLDTAAGSTLCAGTPPGTWKVADPGQQKLVAS